VVLVSFVVFVACVQLLNASDSPRLAAGVFSAGKIVSALLFGGGSVPVLIGAVVVCLLAFGYFWLLHRMEGTGLWWLVLVGGVVLLA